MNTDAILSGIVLVLFVILLVVLHKARKARAEEQGPDVGVAVFVEDCTMVHDCDGCEECGAPMVIDDEYQPPPLEEDRLAMRLGLVPLGAELAFYGTRVVHRHCLMARRDGRAACVDCARVMVGAA